MIRSSISSILNEEGKKYEGSEVAEQFVTYFHQFLGVARDVNEINDPGSLFVNKVDVDEANRMVCDITNEEIKDAVFGIDDNKSPGPDGYTAKFYKKAWDIIGVDICKAIHGFFQTGVLPMGVNATMIALVPKIATPNKVSDFRPIACCNVLYKAISKILTKSIKKSFR